MKATILVMTLAGCVATSFGQGPPPVMQIIREAVKEGRGAAHKKVEQDYANTFRKAKFPFNYIALNSSSGPGEVWFVTGLPSFAAIEQSDKESDKEPLKSALAMMEGRDGELRASSRTLIAVLRPDLCYTPENGVSLGKVRYVMVETFRVRLGHDEDFANGAKMFTGAMKKAKLNTPGYFYQVVVGAPEGTYLLFAPMPSLKEMDEEQARQKALVEAMGAENFSRLMKSAGDVFQTMEATLFSVSPEMSYAPKAIEDEDPAFWRPKAAPAAAAKPKEPKAP
jgi:hypothetical protein